MIDKEEFIIKDGILKIYQGHGGKAVIPSGITTIDGGAFYACNDLTSVVLPNSLTSIHIPDSVTKISETAFAECPNLTFMAIHEKSASRFTQMGDR